MGSLLEKVKGFFGSYSEEFEEYYEEEDEYDYEQEQEQVRPALKIVPKRQEEENTNLITKPSRDMCKHVDYRPHRYEDMENVVNALCTGKAVVLHLDGVDPRLCQRVLDFAAGVVCSLKCISSMPNDHVCILIPNDKDFFGTDAM